VRLRRNDTRWISSLQLKFSILHIGQVTNESNKQTMTQATKGPICTKHILRVAALIYQNALQEQCQHDTHTTARLGTLLARRIYHPALFSLTLRCADFAAAPPHKVAVPASTQTNTRTHTHNNHPTPKTLLDNRHMQLFESISIVCARFLI